MFDDFIKHIYLYGCSRYQQIEVSSENTRIIFVELIKNKTKKLDEVQMLENISSKTDTDGEKYCFCNNLQHIENDKQTHFYLYLSQRAFIAKFKNKPTRTETVSLC